MDTATIVNRVIEVGRRVANRKTQRFLEAANIGDAARQGDVFIALIDKVPTKAKKIPVPTQLAPGTQGSRHTLDSIEGVTAYQLAEPTEFDGPVLDLAEEREVCHPEHGHIVFPPGVYQVTYQRTQDALDRARRVQD